MVGGVFGSPLAAGAGPVSIAIDRGNAFAFVSNNSAGTIGEYALNPTTGALTPISGSPIAAGTNPLPLTIHPPRRYLFAANPQPAQQVPTFATPPPTGPLPPSPPTAPP